MDVRQALLQRRAHHRFHPDRPVDEALLRRLVARARLAPTSFNMQNVHWVLVTDPERRRALWEASWKQEQVGTAPVLVVLAGDLTAHRSTDRFLYRAPEEARARLHDMIQGIYEGNERLLRDEACRSVGLAGMALMLAAEEEGLGSCPMIGFDPDAVSGLLGLDEDHPPLLMVTLGYPSDEPRPRLGFRTWEESVSRETFGQPAWTGPFVPEEEV